jgi:hypothetical protein
MIEAGANILRSLDKAKLVVRGALWLYLSEENCWRLFFALPEVRGRIPLQSAPHEIEVRT